MKMTWTPQDDEILLALEAQGKSRVQIAKLYGTTKGVISGRIYRLKCKRRSMPPKLLPYHGPVALLTYQPQEKPVIELHGPTSGAWKKFGPSSYDPGEKVRVISPTMGWRRGEHGWVEWRGDGVIERIVGGQIRVIEDIEERIGTQGVWIECRSAHSKLMRLNRRP